MVYIKEEKFNSVDRIHKLSVIFALFYKDDIDLSNYIINILRDMDKSLSRYTLKMLFLYISCSKKVHAFPFLTEACVRYINSFRGTSGAYSNYYHTSENIGATFDALFILKWINLSFTPSYETLDFINRCYYRNRGFATKPQNGRVTISSIFDGYFICKEFGIKIETLNDDIIKYIEKSYMLFSDKQLFQAIIILKTIIDNNTKIFDYIY